MALSRKDYTLAASLVKSTRERFVEDDGRLLNVEQIKKADAAEELFVDFFRQSEGRFDEARFRAACR